MPRCGGFQNHTCSTQSGYGKSGDGTCPARSNATVSQRQSWPPVAPCRNGSSHDDPCPGSPVKPPRKDDQHGILTQSPRGGLTLATTGRPARRQTPLGTIEAIHLKTDLFFAFSEARMADSEKAFLDLVYSRSRKGLRPLIAEDLDLSVLNRKKLRNYMTRFPPWIKTRQIPYE